MPDVPEVGTPDPDDDATQIPEGFEVVCAEDADDETADQAGDPPTPELLERLHGVAWQAAAAAQDEGLI